MTTIAPAARKVLAALEELRFTDSQRLGDPEQLTMSQLATAAGVSRATLYRLFGSQEHLLQQLGVEPASTVRARILDIAADQVGRRGTAALSMEELAASAGVSRATIYRLFPGKSALLAELLREHSPFNSLADVLQEKRHLPPDEVVPTLATSIAKALDGRMGLLLEVLSEATKEVAETGTGSAVEPAGAAPPAMRSIPLLIGYLEEQMAAGRLRRMQPSLALQALLGPMVMHLLSRPVDAAGHGHEQPAPDLTAVVEEFAAVWLRGMAPRTGE